MSSGYVIVHESGEIFHTSGSTYEKYDPNMTPWLTLDSAIKMYEIQREGHKYIVPNFLYTIKTYPGYEVVYPCEGGLNAKR